MKLLKEEEGTMDTDGRYPISKIIRALADLIFQSEFLGNYHVKSAKEKEEIDDVRASALFALKNISIKTSGETDDKSKVKFQLGRYAADKFLEILNDPRITDVKLINYLLLVLYSLSFDPRIASRLKDNKIEDALVKRRPEFANLCNQIERKMRATNYKKIDKSNEEEYDEISLAGTVLKQSRAH